jgi:hypothetical protein
METSATSVVPENTTLTTLHLFPVPVSTLPHHISLHADACVSGMPPSFSNFTHNILNPRHVGNLVGKLSQPLHPSVLAAILDGIEVCWSAQHPARLPPTKRGEEHLPRYDTLTHSQVAAVVAEVGSAVDGVPVVPICLVPDFQDKLPDPQHQIVVETADFPWSWCEFQVLLEWFFVRFFARQHPFHHRLRRHLALPRLRIRLDAFAIYLSFFECVAPHLPFFTLLLRASALVVPYLTAAPTLPDPPDWKQAGGSAGATVVSHLTAERAAYHPDTWFPTELTEPSEREKRVELLGVRCARVADGLRLGRYPYYFWKSNPPLCCTRPVEGGMTSFRAES